MSPTDPADEGFLDRVAKILDRDKDEVSADIEALDAIALLDLTDAVAREDDVAVRDILSSTSGSEEAVEDDGANVDLDTDDGDESDVEDEGEPRHKHVDDDDDALFDTYAPLRKGERVRVGLEEGIVQVPSGPGNTVGVRMQGRLRMVERAEVHRLEERVVGMTLIPDIKRMQQLAGIGIGMADDMQDCDIADTAVQVQKIEMPTSDVGKVLTPGPVPTGSDGSAQAATAALDQLERLLPDVRVGEMKPIRKRIYDMMAKLNESASKPEPVVRENNAKRPSLRDYLKDR